MPSYFIIPMGVKKLKVGYFCDTFYPMTDGVVKVLDNYAANLCKRCDVVVFVPEGRGNFDDSSLPYKVVRCKRLRVLGLDYDLPLPELDRHFMKTLKECKLDIVHVHSPFTLGNAGLRYARKHRIPCVATMHSQFKLDFERSLKTPLMKPALAFMMWRLRKFFDSATECWAVNKEVARIFHEDYGVGKLPEVVRNGTDMAVFADKEYVDSLKSGYGISSDEKVLLFVGRINVLKNVDFLVRSLAVLDKEGFRFKALLVGEGQDFNAIKRLVSKSGLKGKVLMPGKITDRKALAAHYALADLFVFPSLYDSSSLVQIEAASQHTPSLFLKGAATSATVTPGIDGYISDRDITSYAHKIEEIFADEVCYRKVCMNAFDNLYVTWPQVVDEVYERYLSLSGKSDV